MIIVIWVHRPSSVSVAKVGEDCAERNGKLSGQSQNDAAQVEQDGRSVQTGS